jgi:hypothetical protein
LFLVPVDPSQPSSWAEQPRAASPELHNIYYNKHLQISQLLVSEWVSENCEWKKFNWWNIFFSIYCEWFSYFCAFLQLFWCVCMSVWLFMLLMWKRIINGILHSAFKKIKMKIFFIAQKFFLRNFN